MEEEKNNILNDKRIFPGFLSDTDILKYLNTDIVICPFNNDQLTPVGYNLSFTRFIFSVNKKRLYKIYKDEVTKESYCIIDANDTALIMTQEAVWVSENIAGTFHSKVGMVSLGFGHISTTLDPNWEGPLLISLNNPTKKKIKMVISEETDGNTKYKTFVTLIFYRMVSKALGEQDNKPSRIEILKDSTKDLPSNKQYKELIKIIDTISHFEAVHVGIGKANHNDRSKKIDEFIQKYSTYAYHLNTNIGQAEEISNRIANNNKYKYNACLIVLCIPIVFLIFMGISGYLVNDNAKIALAALIMAPTIPIETCIKQRIKKALR